MWWPRKCADLLAALEAGDLRESHSLDLKSALPARKRSIDLAIDVCSMTPDGGVVIYGIDEEDGLATEPLPFDLAGQVDRIYQIVRSSISEPPRIEVLPLDDPSAGPGAGYLVVVVPVSARAPHQVTVGGERRYYGRNGTENVPLNEGEVARLYARRGDAVVEQDAALNQVIADGTLSPSKGFAPFFFTAGPVYRGDELFSRAREALAVEGRGDYPAVLSSLVTGADPMGRCSTFEPCLSRLHSWADSSRGLFASTAPDGGPDLREASPREALKMEVTYEGDVRIWCGRGVHPVEDSRFVMECVIGGLTVQALRVAGLMYDAAGYAGPLDLGVAVLGLRGAVSYELHGQGFSGRPWVGYDTDDYRRTARVPAVGLADDPVSAATEVLTPLFRSTLGRQHQAFFQRYKP